ncbi:MAG: HD family phosphohydrolase [Planctomycetota bacterium]|jgi:putative nucleotidyltransferase with HDIG domain
MGFFRKKTSPRRSRVRKSMAGERLSRQDRPADSDIISLALLWLLLFVLCGAILSFELIQQTTYLKIGAVTAIVALVSGAVVLYIYHYQRRIITNRTRTLALAGLFIVLLAAAKLGTLLTKHTWWATGTAVAIAIILTIAYNQRFAIGMSLFYCVFACFVDGNRADINLFLAMAAGGITCCFSLREIRTRIKLLEVSAMAAVVVFATVMASDILDGFGPLGRMFGNAGFHAGLTLTVGMLIQSLLPLIERIFRIATSMTLLDYSDANQSLLKKLAMEAPGTFSHSLLIGSIAEAAAEAIGRNGLLCRVGAYYHDIGKINKPGYFVENEMGSASRHKELSPAMSQLVIIGHVKDGIEMAKEYSLPGVLRQFIETHHGTTLVEYFYNEAKKKYDEKVSNAAQDAKKSAPPLPPPSESEFRYPGPKPRTKEAAIVMLADTVEGAVRSLGDATPTRIEAVVHNMAMKRLQDGQFDECDMSLRELSQIEASISKALAAHYHGRIAYPKPPDLPEAETPDNDKDRNPPTAEQSQPEKSGQKKK